MHRHLRNMLCGAHKSGQVPMLHPEPCRQRSTHSPGARSKPRLRQRRVGVAVTLDTHPSLEGGGTLILGGGGFLSKCGLRKRSTLSKGSFLQRILISAALTNVVCWPRTVKSVSAERSFGREQVFTLAPDLQDAPLQGLAGFASCTGKLSQLVVFKC